MSIKWHGGSLEVAGLEVKGYLQVQLEPKGYLQVQAECKGMKRGFDRVVDGVLDIVELEGILTSKTGVKEKP